MDHKDWHINTAEVGCDGGSSVAGMRQVKWIGGLIVRFVTRHLLNKAHLVVSSSL